MYRLVKNCPAQCSGGAAQRLLEITGTSLPALPMMTHLQIKSGPYTLENTSHRASSGLWPLSWSCLVRITLQQISFWAAGTLLSQEFWPIYISIIGVSKIIPILSIIILVLGYFNYKNSRVPPCCAVFATHLRSRKGHTSDITPVLQ